MVIQSPLVLSTDWVSGRFSSDMSGKLRQPSTLNRVYMPSLGKVILWHRRLAWNKANSSKHVLFSPIPSSRTVYPKTLDPRCLHRKPYIHSKTPKPSTPRLQVPKSSQIPKFLSRNLFQEPLQDRLNPKPSHMTCSAKTLASENQSEVLICRPRTACVRVCC